MSVLEKSAQILDFVAEFPDQATLTSIANHVAQPRSSVHRLLAELVQLGLLLRVDSTMYAPGPRLGRWGQAAEEVGQIVRIAEPVMVQLRDAVGESVHLYVRQRDRRVCIAAIDGRYELRHFTEIGKPLPLSVGASGKLLLAHADRAVQQEELRRAADKPLTPRAPSLARLERQLRTIAETDWSTSFGEREAGLAAAAVPVRNNAGEVIAALTVSGPTARLTAARFEQICPEVKDAASRISRALGWRAAAVTASAGLK